MLKTIIENMGILFGGYDDLHFGDDTHALDQDENIDETEDMDDEF